MKHYGLTIAEGSEITNATVATGTSFPGNESVGELFFRTDQSILYVWDGTEWDVASPQSDSTRISDGDAGDAETYIDTAESSNRITSQVAESSEVSAFQPFSARGSDGNVSLNAGSAKDGAFGGGTIALWAGAGAAGSEAGSISINAGDGGVSSSDGGDVYVNAGDGVSGGGALEFRAGNSTGNNDIGRVILSSGFRTGHMDVGPHLYLGSITGSITGAKLAAASGSGNNVSGGTLKLTAGDGGTTNSDGGDVQIYVGAAAGTGADGTVDIRGDTFVTSTSGTGPASLYVKGTSPNLIIQNTAGSTDQEKWVFAAAATSYLNIGTLSDDEVSASTAFRIHRSGSGNGIDRIETFDPLRVQNGNATIPQYAFTNSTNSGLYYDPTTNSEGAAITSSGSGIVTFTDEGIRLKLTSAPTTDVTGYGYLYIDTADDVIKYREAGGTVHDLTAGGLENVVEDTTPELGGDLDVNGHIITTDTIGQDVVLTAADGDASTNGGDVALNGGVGGDGRNGGLVKLQGGSSGTGGIGGGILINSGTPTQGAGGTISVNGGDGGGTNSAGGDIFITSGDSTGTGGAGDLWLEAGASVTGAAGRTYLVGGNGTGTDTGGGRVTIDPGDGTGAGDGGDAIINSGVGGATGDGGDINLNAGTGGSTSGDGGNVNVYAGYPSNGAGGDIKFFAGTGNTNGDITLNTGGSNRLVVEVDGTLNVVGTANYETLVLDDDDIPNKKYVDDALTNGNLNIVEDTTPQLGGTLDVNGYSIVGKPAGATDNGGSITLTAAQGGATSGDGGHISLNCGDGNGSFGEGGRLSLYGGDGATSSSEGGRIDMFGGNGGPGGRLNIKAGQSTTGTGPRVDITGGTSLDSTGGQLNLTGGLGVSGQSGGATVVSSGGGDASTFNASSLTLNGGLGTGYGSSLTLAAGSTSAVNGNGGAITIVAGAGDGTGDGGNVIVSAGSTATGDGGDFTFNLGGRTGAGTSQGVLSLKVGGTPAQNTAAEMRLYEADPNEDYIGIKAPDSPSGSRTWTLPDDDPSVVDGYFLTTDSSGNLSFAEVEAGGATTAQLVMYEYTATSGQTTFSGTDDNGETLSYSVGNLLVFQNGTLLDPDDYTATNGTSVVLDTGAGLGHEINILRFNAVESFNTLKTYRYLMDDGDTTVSGTDAKGNALTYAVGLLSVFLNGSKLSEDEYTATTGTSVVLDTAVSSDNSILEIQTYSTFTSVDQTVARPNLLMNGNFNIWQRGWDLTLPDAEYTADRWHLGFNGAVGATFGATKVDVAAIVPGSKSAFSLSVDVADATLSGGDFIILSQGVEGYDIINTDFGTSNAKSITLSFKVRSSKTGTYCVSIRNKDGNRCYVAEYTISTADVYETKVITIPGCTDGTWWFDENKGLHLDFCLGIGTTYTGTADTWLTANAVATSNQVNIADSTSNTWYVTQIRLEVGTEAGSYVDLPQADELARCQRFYEKSYSVHAIPGTSATYRGQEIIRLWGLSNVINGYRRSVKFAVAKRTVPTVTMYSPVNGTSNKYHNWIAAADENATVIDNGTSGFVWSTSTAASTTLSCGAQWAAEADY